MKAKKFEFYFDIGYLATIIVFTCLFLFNKSYQNWALMSFVLFFGDSAHLIPRIFQNVKNKYIPFFIGYGKMLTSITMSVFYVLLWHISIDFYTLSNPMPYTYTMYILCLIRIILTVLPQNRWIDETYINRWPIYRNIPFFLQGFMMLLLFVVSPNKVENLHYLPIAVALSFIFYIPVVLWVHKKPALGMLMIPKTICYIWILSMGFAL